MPQLWISYSLGPYITMASLKYMNVLILNIFFKALNCSYYCKINDKEIINNLSLLVQLSVSCCIFFMIMHKLKPWVISSYSVLPIKILHIRISYLLWVISSLTKLRVCARLNPALNDLNLPSCPCESDPQLKTWPHSLIVRVWQAPHDALVIRYCDKLSTFSVTNK
jgi:hypothetical protein